MHGKHWKIIRDLGHKSLLKYGIRQKHFKEIIEDETDLLIQRFERKLNVSMDPAMDLMLTIVNISARLVFGERFEENDDDFNCIVDILNSNLNNKTK